MGAPSQIDVVVRCRNEMPHVERALAGLAAQRRPRARVWMVDCHSTDGSREQAERAGVAVHDLDPEAYVPGVVLNLGMRRTVSPIVAFVNADAVPLSDDALGRLVEPLLVDGRVAAAYGRQLARPDADRQTRLDHDRAFGPAEAVRVRHGAFFSMAASAVRRDVWQRLPFDESLRYSEDVDWVRRIGALGWHVRYVPEARFEHSHAYNLRGQWRRRAGEGAADARIHRLGPPSVLGDLARPLAGALMRDLRAGAIGPCALATRCAQAGGYWAGRRRGA